MNKNREIERHTKGMALLLCRHISVYRVLSLFKTSVLEREPIYSTNLKK